MHFSICSMVSTVPMPTAMPGSSFFSATSASSAQGVRRVSSIAVRPPLSSAAESLRASSTLSAVTTGRMPAWRSSCSALAWVWAMLMDRMAPCVDRGRRPRLR
jgi:hypothetical protein